MSSLAPSCLIVGAGVSGLLIARGCAARGLRVSVLDKGRRPGGRLATRTLRQPGQPDAICDHGAQFFTVREDAFAHQVQGWLQAGIAAEWCRGFGPRPDGHPRYRGVAGMKSIPLHLAEGVRILCQTRVTSASARTGRWAVTTENGMTHRADVLVLTPPVPQSLALLAAGGTELPSAEADALAEICYAPCLAVLAALEGPSEIPAPGAIRPREGPIAWVADNRQKGISPQAAGVTLHANAEFSEEAYDWPAERTTAHMLAAARAWLPRLPRRVLLHRWRYSKPTGTYPQRCLGFNEPAKLVFAGDAFAGPRVEGAALSGLAAVEEIANLLGRP